MTEKKRKRGRPKLPTPITEDYASSRRQAVNAMYMYEAVDLIKPPPKFQTAMRCGLPMTGRAPPLQRTACWSR